MERLSDTDPDFAEAHLARLRAMTPEERLEQFLRLMAAERALALAGIDARWPGASEEERRMRLASMWTSRDDMIRHFGWDPDERGR